MVIPPRPMDERGVSEVVSHALAIGITMMLMIGLVGATMTVIERNRLDAADDTSGELAQQVARVIEDMDRLVRESESSGPISQRVDLPSRLGGKSYSIEVLSSADAATSSLCTQAGYIGNEPNVGCIIIRIGSERTRVVHFRTSQSVTVQSAAFSGGSIRIVRRAGDGTLISVEAVGGN